MTEAQKKEFIDFWYSGKDFENLQEESYPSELCKWYEVWSKGRKLDLDNPMSFSEKLNWLKLFDKNPLKTIFADKYLAPLYAKKSLPGIGIVKQLHVWNSADEIDFAELPEQFVLKCNHGSGMNIIVKDKSAIDVDEIRFKLNVWMNVSYAHKNHSFELHYQKIPRKIIAEEYLAAFDKHGLLDYKVHCFNGKPKFIQVIGNRNYDVCSHADACFDLNWNRLNMVHDSVPVMDGNIEKPANLKLLIKYAKVLSKPFYYVRADFYILNGKIYFGELTFSPNCGVFNWTDQNIDMKLGELLKLPIKKSKNFAFRKKLVAGKKKVKDKIRNRIFKFIEPQLANLVQKKIKTDIMPVLNTHSQQTVDLYNRVGELGKVVGIHSEQATDLYKRVQEMGKVVGIHSEQTIDLYKLNSILFDNDADFFNKFLEVSESFWNNYNYICNKRKNNSKVIYTCLTGDYDFLPTQLYVNPDYDYVCFTDNADLLKQKSFGAWIIKPLAFAKFDDARNNRWHKLHPHILFPEYTSSIYIDSNISIKSGWIFDEINRRNKNILIPLHFERDCIYDECEEVRKNKKDLVENLDKMVHFLKENKFPSHYGLNENNLLYRVHNDSLVIRIMEEWWFFIENYSRRDQMSLSYVLWRNGISPKEISMHNLRNLIYDFQFNEHKIKIPFSKIDSLPRYHILDCPKNLRYDIEKRFDKNLNSYIKGWVFSSDYEFSVYCESNGVVYKSEKINRPDVKLVCEQGFVVGFEFLINPCVKNGKIYFVNFSEQEIYCKEL